MLNNFFFFAHSNSRRTMLLPSVNLGTGMISCVSHNLSICLISKGIKSTLDSCFLFLDADFADYTDKDSYKCRDTSNEKDRSSEVLRLRS
jgi:hypothetical protein